MEIFYPVDAARLPTTVEAELVDTMMCNRGDDAEAEIYLDACDDNHMMRVLDEKEFFEMCHDVPADYDW